MSRLQKLVPQKIIINTLLITKIGYDRTLIIIKPMVFIGFALNDEQRRFPLLRYEFFE